MDTESIGPDGELLAKYRSVCENALRRLTADLKADDVAGRDAAYAKIRESNEAFIRNNSGKFGESSASAFRDVVEETIAQDARDSVGVGAASAEDQKAWLRDRPQPAGNPGDAPHAKRRPRPALLGGLVGFAIAVFAGFAVWVIGAPPATEAARQGLFEEKFAKALPQVEAAAQFLGRVEQEIVKRQESDGAALAAVAGKTFVPLDKVLPDLAKEIPSDMPDRTITLVRATDTAYKVLFRSRLCTAVEFARPDMLDRRREPAKTAGLGCEFFGIWNKPGAKF